VHFGEGDYSGTGQLIRELLQQAHPGHALPAPASRPDLTPTGELSPETYVGYERLQYLLTSRTVARNTPAVYHFPRSLPLGGMGLAGTWTVHAQEATAGPAARLELGFHAQEIYLVLGGAGKLAVTIDGRPAETIDVRGVPRLYTLYHAGSASSGTLVLHAAPGVQAYDFTFG
jgi:hypothetical protein